MRISIKEVQQTLPRDIRESHTPQHVIIKMKTAGSSERKQASTTQESEKEDYQQTSHQTL